MSSSPQLVLNIAGYSTCGFFKRAVQVLSSLPILFPSKIKVIEHAFPGRDEYRSWLLGPNDAINNGFRSKILDDRARNHVTSPFVWISDGVYDSYPVESASHVHVTKFIGGHDDTLEWCRNFVGMKDEPISTSERAVMVNDGYTADHPYDYDLVVIGGGSGGLAASKEATRVGASKVAVLDFVKPSWQNSVWGLGGTCVNVGCIPKKLMHQAALIHQTITSDATAFGIRDGLGKPTMTDQDTVAETGFSSIQHNWQVMREHVQNYIHSLNFKYRVALREKNVTYLNQLGTFRDAHTLDVVDKKGKTSTITAARFLIAVGGRPTTLDCEGGELAISSDDIFSLEKSPGKTLCVGASYISLECAGFLAGLGYDVTVAVRSILLRGFDRECADLIGSYMEEHGVVFRREVIPKKLEKIPSEDMSTSRIKVTFSDDTVDTFDTVLVAIGRSADTTKLGLDKVGIKTNPRNGKIPTKYEQTIVPNIYAIGDVMENCPELTPVAIQAGKILAQRLFAGSTEPMDYTNVCTTVFTPIEYGTVGYSEEAAIEKFGSKNIEVYHKSFVPLEWTLSPSRSHSQGFAKVIVDTSKNEKVLGIHYVGPSAGEVMQGYGVAIKKGITFNDLTDTVGIHPTCSEEIVRLNIKKSSGEDASAEGC